MSRDKYGTFRDKPCPAIRDNGTTPLEGVSLSRVRAEYETVNHD